MPNIITKYLILVFACLVVLYPLWISGKNLAWSLSPIMIFNLFPLLGLLAFTLLWLHVVSGVFESWLRKYINFNRFAVITSNIIIACIILHPLLLLINADFELGPIFSYGKIYIWLGITGWLLLVTYDLGRFFKNHDFVVQHWNKIRLISTVGFILTFFHSLGVGESLQVGTLRTIWIFYGVTAIMATIYLHGVKRLFS
jgi:hypothetical protein